MRGAGRRLIYRTFARSEGPRNRKCPQVTGHGWPITIKWGECVRTGTKMPPDTLSHRRSPKAAPAKPAGVAPIAAVVTKTVPAQGSGGTRMASKTAAAGSVTNTPTTPRKPTRDIREIWVEYKKNKTEPLRNALMENYLHLVRYNAERIHVKLPDEVELDDLMSAGIFGLMDAINAFDLDRGVKFETYCAPRIRGAILDE